MRARPGVAVVVGCLATAGLACGAEPPHPNGYLGGFDHVWTSPLLDRGAMSSVTLRPDGSSYTGLAAGSQDAQDLSTTIVAHDAGGQERWRRSWQASYVGSVQVLTLESGAVVVESRDACTVQRFAADGTPGTTLMVPYLECRAVATESGVILAGRLATSLAPTMARVDWDGTRVWTHEPLAFGDSSCGTVGGMTVDGSLLRFAGVAESCPEPGPAVSSVSMVVSMSIDTGQVVSTLPLAVETRTSVPRPGGAIADGNGDLYAAFRSNEGSWLHRINLAESQTRWSADFPSLSFRLLDDALLVSRPRWLEAFDLESGASIGARVQADVPEAWASDAHGRSLLIVERVESGVQLSMYDL